MLSEQECKFTYTGNGATTEFPFSFAILDKTDIKAYIVKQNGIKTDLSGLNIVMNDESDLTKGGHIVCSLANGDTITIYRDTPKDQQLDLTDQGRVVPESLEKSLDKLTMMVQEQQEEIDEVNIPKETIDTASQLLAESKVLVNDAQTLKDEAQQWANGDGEIQTGLYSAKHWANVAKEGSLSDCMINVKSFGAKGDGLTDDTTAVQSAIDYAHNNHNGGQIFFPGSHICRKLTIYDNIYLVGNGRTSVIKLKDGTNDNLIEGYLSSTLWGGGSSAGLTHYGLTNIELDGNRANNMVGNVVAVYGQEAYIKDVLIKNSPENGIVTEWADGGDEFGMEGYFENIKIDSCGKNGWLFKGPHDSTAKAVIVIDAGLLANNTYDGIQIIGNSNGRFDSCHVWTRGVTANRMRYGVNDSTGGNEFVSCHFEGCYSANVYANGSLSSYKGCRFYAPWNGVNIIVKKPVYLDGILTDPPVGRPACKGIVLGENSSDNPATCMINVLSYGQTLGVVDFAYSKGGNDIKVNGVNTSGVAYSGTPHYTDIIDLNIIGAGGGTLLRKIIDTSTGNSAAGSNQTDAFVMAQTPCYVFSVVSSGQGTRLYAHQRGVEVSVFNVSGANLLVYPDPGSWINSLSANAPVTIPAGKGGRFIKVSSSAWCAIIG